MLVEFGFVRAATSEGTEFTFTPSLGRIAALGNPQEIVRLYAGLHEAAAARDAAYILASLCDQADPTQMLGWIDEAGYHAGLMPAIEQILIARHLMQHGIAGKARPGGSKGDGKFSDKFEATEYIAAARVHLGLSSADAEALSMTEFQMMFEMKFPKKGGDGKRDVPTRDEYNASLAAIEGRRVKSP